MSTEEEKYRHIREYSRVDAYLPLHVRLVPKEEQNDLQSRMSMESVLTDPQPLPFLEDDALSECLKILNTKLSTIINMLASKRESLCSLAHTRVNLSGGGMRIGLGEEFTPDDIVEIKLMLPTASYALYTLYGQVVRCEVDGDGQYNTCIEFTEIDEDIRDRITKYVFEKQREILRRIRRQ